MSDAADREQSVQNDFFNEARKTRARVAIVLTSGKRITGRIKAFDRFAVVIDAGGSDEMVFKHAIATVSLAVFRPGHAEGPGGAARAPRPTPGAAQPPSTQPQTAGTTSTGITSLPGSAVQKPQGSAPHEAPREPVPEKSVE